jgi:hypothetical protein
MVRRLDRECTHAVHLASLADFDVFHAHVYACARRRCTTLAQRAPFACMGLREKRAKSAKNGTMITFVVHRAIV